MAAFRGSRSCVLSLALVLFLMVSQEQTVSAFSRGRKALSITIPVRWKLPYTGVNTIKLIQGVKVNVAWDYSDKKLHNVVQLANEAAYKACDFTKSKVICGTSKKGSCKIPWPGKKKNVYYACSVDAKNNRRGHCSAGQKLAIRGL